MIALVQKNELEMGIQSSQGTKMEFKRPYSAFSIGERGIIPLSSPMIIKHATLTILYSKNEVMKTCYFVIIWNSNIPDFNVH